MPTLIYDAFVSYSHKADGALSSRLQRALETIATPWYRRRSIRVFRDETTLKPTPALWNSIQTALDQSRYFILLASPQAARSAWVDKEIAHWLATSKRGFAPPIERLLLALTDGRLVWDAAAHPVPDFARTEPRVLPAALQGAFRQEPLYVDFTWAQTPETLTLKHRPFFDNVARLAAAVRGIELDELIGEDNRQHRRTLGTALTGGALVLGLGATAVLTWHQAQTLTLEKQHQTDAERVLPQLDAQLVAIRNAPTRDIAIEFVPESFFGESPAILELRLELDPLFTVPMSFFFARYVEGKTWPPDFGFTEPDHTEFSHQRARVDVKFAWFDRVLALQQEIDGTDTGIRPRFDLQLDGKEFMPGGPGLNLPQKMEIPSLQSLIDKKVRFRLIVHDPVARTAHEIDPATRPVTLRVLAAHDMSGTQEQLVLFDGNPSPLQKDALAGDYLFSRGPIERMVLLNLYPPVVAERRRADQALRDELLHLLKTRRPETADQRRLLARGVAGAARLAVVRGDPATALNAFLEVGSLLGPLVIESKGLPRREDGEAFYEAAVQPVAFYVRSRRFDDAQKYLPKLALIAERMLADAPDEPDYQRWRADAHLWEARVAAGTERWEQLATSLQSYVQCLTRVHEQIGSEATRNELVGALSQAIELAAKAPSGEGLSAPWRAELRRLSKPDAQRPTASASRTGR
jgi:hypothetical protein